MDNYKLRDVIHTVLTEHPDDFISDGVIKVVIEYRTFVNIENEEHDILAGYALYTEEDGKEDLYPIDHDYYSLDDLVIKYEVSVIPEEDGDPEELYLTVWY